MVAFISIKSEGSYTCIRFVYVLILITCLAINKMAVLYCNRSISIKCANYNTGLFGKIKLTLIKCYRLNLGTVIFMNLSTTGTGEIALFEGYISAFNPCSVPRRLIIHKFALFQTAGSAQHNITKSDILSGEVGEFQIAVLPSCLIITNSFILNGYILEGNIRNRIGRTIALKSNAVISIFANDSFFRHQQSLGVSIRISTPVVSQLTVNSDCFYTGILNSSKEFSIISNSHRSRRQRNA